MSNLEEAENSNWQMELFKGHRGLEKKTFAATGICLTLVFKFYIGSIDWRNPADLATSSGLRDGQPLGITTPQGRGFESWWQQQLF